MDCVCRNREKAFDPVSGKNSTEDIVMFKDKILIKNIILSEIHSSLKKYQSSKHII